MIYRVEQNDIIKRRAGHIGAENQKAPKKDNNNTSPGVTCTEKAYEVKLRQIGGEL